MVNEDDVYETTSPGKRLMADDFCPHCEARVDYDMPFDDTDPKPNEEFHARCWDCGGLIVVAYEYERHYWSSPLTQRRGEMGKLSRNDPILKAWESYERTGEYEQALRWAEERAFRPGTLWAAFLAGWRAANVQLRADAEEGVE